jgi:Flp pilus assembly protein TadG
MNEGTLMRGDTAPVRPAGGSPPRRSRRGSGGWRDERGTALVEFALVALPLFLVLFGIIDFARALNYYNDLTQLAGQGARAAAVNQNPDSSVPSGTSIQTQIMNAADSPELKATGGNGLQVCLVPPTPTPPSTTYTGLPLTVSTSYRFHFIPLLKVGVTLRASQTERFEGVTPSYTAGCVQP